MVRVLRSPLTFAEFQSTWYSEDSDKKGKFHLSNMCMSMFQSRKANAGSGFERVITKEHSRLGINVLNQVCIDSSGNIHDKKPKGISVHKVDTLIPTTKDVKNISSMIVLSKKTTLRERYRQDLDIRDKCKKLIFLTKETPTKTQLDTIAGYGCIVVYPYAEITTTSWSYAKYFSEISILNCR